MNLPKGRTGGEGALARAISADRRRITNGGLLPKNLNLIHRVKFSGALRATDDMDRKPAVHWVGPAEEPANTQWD